MCSSRLVTWSLVSQSQSWLQQSYRHFCFSRSGNRNGKFSEIKNCIFNLPLLISVISRVSLRREGVYLRAVNLHGQRPSSIPTFEVSHVTVNRDLLWTKHQRVYLASSRPYGKRGSRKKIKSRQLMCMFIIKVVMLAAILFLKLLFSVVPLFSYSLIKFLCGFVLVCD